MEGQMEGFPETRRMEGPILGEFPGDCVVSVKRRSYLLKRKERRCVERGLRFPRVPLIDGYTFPFSSHVDLIFSVG